MIKKIGVIGLGYVGLPVAVNFGKEFPVLGFDIDKQRIKQLTQGIDCTNEVVQADILQTNIEFTTDSRRLREVDFIIICVPTPIDSNHQPNLSHLLAASETVGKHLQKNTIVVYESTVYPGATEEECIPVLERASGLRCGEDFFVGYSPERINPGDHIHTFSTIKKVVSAREPKVLDIIAETYGKVIGAGIHKSSSIKVAEAAKVIENTQRDVNIALMNEFALIFDRLGIDTTEVIEAARTKWNFIHFTPGLVGGHCIGVDPYYLTYKAKMIGHHPEVILAGRRMNDDMGKFIALTIVKKLIKHDVAIQGALVTVLGLSFKENVRDLRNSKVVDIIRELQDFGLTVQVNDDLVNPEIAKMQYGIDVIPLNELEKSDAVVLAVPHRHYVDAGWRQMEDLLKEGASLVIDIKSVLDLKKKPSQIDVWRL
ncbi:nucleotide sugar dehydrogenase [Sporosarcina sp. UB5]|uniref:nucleotide sugar dehydrogenase n=1 Tax=Sporosarcina sp. UB5 TaxID=3047463 RepID=UPI003D7BBE46